MEKATASGATTPATTRQTGLPSSSGGCSLPWPDGYSIPPFSATAATEMVVVVVMDAAETFGEVGEAAAAAAGAGADQTILLLLTPSRARNLREPYRQRAKRDGVLVSGPARGSVASRGI